MKTIIGQLRLLALLEGASWALLLFITMPLKYLLDIPGPNKAIGMIHGVLFIGYSIWVIIAAQEYKWNIKTILLCLIAGLFPFTTFIADSKVFRKESEF